MEGEGKYILHEIHEGICGNYLSTRTLVKKCISVGYYWTTIYKDAKELVRKCSTCQFSTNLMHVPPSDMIPMVSPWPFAQGEFDLLDRFPRALGSFQFPIIAIYYFIKWVEVELLTGIIGKAIQKFF